MDNKSRRVELLLNGKFLIQPRINVETDTISKRSQVNGIAPNVVHSLDASVLHKTVNSAKKCGVNSFLMIHDSYGCHVADIEVMLACAKRSLVQVFSHDQLEHFLLQIKSYIPEEKYWPEIPAYGKLKLDDIIDSEYIFC